jgi:phosphoserine aminotransferase
MSRAYNFSAGPGTLPESVLVELQAALLEFSTCRAGIMEISHRSQPFEDVLQSAKARMRLVLGVPEDYTILFLQGGASLQFYQVPLNLALPTDATDYIDTGTWASKAFAEAKTVSDAKVIWSSKATTYDRVPAPLDVKPREAAAFVHYTTNNTIYGTQCAAPPATDKRLFADMSSDIASRPIDVARHDVIYAGAQKNLGPSGVTAVILSPWALARVAEVKAARGGLPSMLDYTVAAANDSMYNTPNTFGIFALERVLAWVEGQGGLPAVAQRISGRAARLYAALDASDFWKPHAQPDSRSSMNVTFRLKNGDLEGAFVKEAQAAGLMELKGHRSVGGMRASLYNALPDEAVDTLIAFMGDFERRNG